MSIQFEHRVSRRLPFALAHLAVLLLLAGCGGAEPEVTADSPQPSEAQPVAAESSSVELEFWQSVKDSGDADQLLAYIKKYPQGQFVELAETRLKNLTVEAPKAGSQVASKVEPPKTQTVEAPATKKKVVKAGSPKSEPSAKGLNRRDRVLSVARRSLARYSDPRLHIYPDIPRFKADNAASIHGMDPTKILVLYDDGFRAGGKTGFVVTDRRIYWRFVSGADALYLDFQDIQSSIARKNKFLLNGYEVSTTMSSSPRHAAETYADLALALRDAFR